MKTVNPYGMKIKKFKNNVAHHELTLKEIGQIYDVNPHVVNKLFLPAIGRLPPSELKRIEKDKVLVHPMCGEPRLRAPCSHAEAAKIIGTTKDFVVSVRRAIGVLPFNASYDYESEEHKDCLLTPNDIRAYALCRLTHGWGRPKGIDAHLEYLRER